MIPITAAAKLRRHVTNISSAIPSDIRIYHVINVNTNVTPCQGTFNLVQRRSNTQAN